MRGQVHLIAGGVAGVLCWLAVVLHAPLPAVIAFYLTAIAFILGAGAIVIARFESQLSIPERIALACASGIAVAPLFICLLALMHADVFFPPIAFIVAGATIARWSKAHTPNTAPIGDRLWYVVLPLAVFAITAWVSSGRMTETSDGVAIFGDYDTLDLTYYAAISSSLNHTNIIPPVSPFYAGHRVIYSYFPLVLLGAVHKLTGAGLLRSFLWFGWPLFGAVAAGAMFAVCRRLGTLTFAVIATTLVFSGSGFAYIAGWFASALVHLDPLIWSSMFMAPSAEWLFFNTWAPALSPVCVGLYALTRISESTGRWWAALAGLCFGLLFMLKSFGFQIVVPAVGMSAVVALIRRDPTWRRLAAVAIGAVAWAVPWLLAILPFNRVENRGAVVTIEWLSLVRRMLLKTNLLPRLEEFVHRCIGGDPNYYGALTVATVIFLIGGLGLRVVGLGPLLRAAVGAPAMRSWTPLAWIVLLGIAMPFMLAVAPFPNSIQTHMFALFALWPFAVYRIWPPDARPSPVRWLLSAILVVFSIPATLHYARVTHAARNGTPIMTLGSGDLQVIRALRATNVRTTMILNDRPLFPSLYAVEAERRVVLAWSSYVSGDFNPDVDALSAQIESFFGSPSTPGVDDTSLLKQHHVTHVVERVAENRLHPNVVHQLRLVSGTPDVRLYEVPFALRR